MATADSRQQQASTQTTSALPANTNVLDDETRRKYEEQSREASAAFEARSAEAERQRQQAYAEFDQGIGDDPTAGSFPDFDEPGFGGRSKFPAESVAIESAKQLKTGDEVWAQWAGSWEEATVVSLFGDGAAKIHIEGSTAPKEIMLPIHMIRLRPAKPQSTTTAQSRDRSPGVTTSSSSTPPPAEQPFRTWLDSTGKHKTEAQLLSVADGKVTLKRSDGRVVTIPLDRLSPQDQAYVRDLP